MAITTDIQWQGAEQESRVASTIFELLLIKGRFYAEDAPIRQDIDALVDYLVNQKIIEGDQTEVRELVLRSASINSHVFALETSDSNTYIVTTKRGRPPKPASVDTVHTFRSRLFEGARQPSEEEELQIRGLTKEIPEDILATPPVQQVQVETEAPAVEPQEQVVAPEAEVEEAPSRIRYLRIDDTLVDLDEDLQDIIAKYHDAFKAKLEDYLAQDFRLAVFGDEYFVEDRLERLSKGQLRDIREYIQERGEPISDEEILSDALSRSLQEGDYNLQRFTINYRLLREKKEFKFVGTKDDRLWTVTNLPPIGQPFRKPSEIAQDYRFMSDPELIDDEDITEIEGSDGTPRLQVKHILTYYEYENGVLPVSPAMEKLMPKPLLEDQNVIVLRIQDPQSYAQYLAELRLGGGNRGTYIGGLDELFQNTLVPGAIFYLVQGESSNAFTIEYERQPAREERILQYDSRRDRWVFTPIVFECAVDDTWLLSESKVGALNGKKRLSDSDRKKLDVIVAMAFEIVGEKADGEYTALIDDLMPVVNIERPISRKYLSSIINSSQYPQFKEDESGLATYTP